MTKRQGFIQRMDSPAGRRLNLELRTQEAQALATAKVQRDWKREQRRAPRDAEWLQFVRALYS